MITGLLKPDSGTVEFNLKTNGENSKRQRVGLCPQELVLWNNLTCQEQLVFIAEMYNVAPAVARERAKVLLEKIGLAEKSKKLVKTLSGGMQRRMNLVMALMHDPDILILDEPEAGLDPQSRVMVRDFILSLSKTKTVIFTTHNMDEADRLANRIAIMDHGKLPDQRCVGK
jgi:ABC-2 type transport system ATP-binding protein